MRARRSWSTITTCPDCTRASPSSMALRSPRTCSRPMARFVDGEPLVGAAPLKDGSRLQMGGQIIECERRSRSDVKKAQELDRDIKKASDYVFSLLPAPLTTGPVRVAWRFVPSAQLGRRRVRLLLARPEHVRVLSRRHLRARRRRGDALGECAERAAPARLAQRRFQEPGGSVVEPELAGFRPTATAGCTSRCAYGVYHIGDRKLTYSSGGHGPAFLVPLDRSAGAAGWRAGPDDRIPSGPDLRRARRPPCRQEARCTCSATAPTRS